MPISTSQAIGSYLTLQIPNTTNATTYQQKCPEVRLQDLTKVARQAREGVAFVEVSHSSGSSQSSFPTELRVRGAGQICSF